MNPRFHFVVKIVKNLRSLQRGSLFVYHSHCFLLYCCLLVYGLLIISQTDSLFYSPYKGVHVGPANTAIYCGAANNKPPDTNKTNKKRKRKYLRSNFLLFQSKRVSPPRQTDRDRQTDGGTDGRTDRQTD